MNSANMFKVSFKSHKTHAATDMFFNSLWRCEKGGCKTYHQVAMLKFDSCYCFTYKATHISKNSCRPFILWVTWSVFLRLKNGFQGGNLGISLDTAW